MPPMYCLTVRSILDGEIDFLNRLLFANHCREAACDLVAALDHVFGDVVKHLGTIVRARFCPARSVARRFHRIANIFTVAERSFAQQLALASIHRIRVARIGPRLLAADVLLHGAVDWATCRLIFFVLD